MDNYPMPSNDRLLTRFWLHDFSRGFARNLLIRIADHANQMELDLTYEFCAKKLWRKAQ